MDFRKETVVSSPGPAGEENRALRVEGTLRNEEGILRASDAQAFDSFGFGVSISGTTVVIGAVREDGGEGDPLDKAGAVYIFEQ